MTSVRSSPTWPHVPSPVPGATWPPTCPTRRSRCGPSVRTLVEHVAAAGADDPSGQAQRAALAEAGLITPHWPAPWGRGASPLEQLVIDEEMAAAGVLRPHLAVGAWALPTIIAHGTEEQQERWVRPTLLGQLNWCQLFSEPGAGSDLAALSTKADRVEGGYVLNGQKVWTSLAQTADFGICLARIGPRRAQARGHHLLHRRHARRGHRHPAAPRAHRRRDVQRGLLQRRLRPRRLRHRRAAATAGGSVARRWPTSASRCRRGASFGNGVESLIRTMARRAERGERLPSSLEERLGHLIAEAQSVALLGHRSTLRTLSGVDPGQRLERAQAARCRARATRAGDGHGALRRRRRSAGRRKPSDGKRVSSPRAASPSPAGRARCSAT